MSRDCFIGHAFLFLHTDIELSQRNEFRRWVACGSRALKYPSVWRSAQCPSDTQFPGLYRFHENVQTQLRVSHRDTEPKASSDGVYFVDSIGRRRHSLFQQIISRAIICLSCPQDTGPKATQRRDLSHRGQTISNSGYGSSSIHRGGTDVKSSRRSGLD